MEKNFMLPSVSRKGFPKQATCPDTNEQSLI